MKKRFIAKSTRKHRKGKVFFLLFLFLLSIFFSVRFFGKVTLKEEYKELVQLLLSHGNSFIQKPKNTTLVSKAVSYLLQVDVKKPSTLLYTSHLDLLKGQDRSTEQMISKDIEQSGHLTENDPVVYIYNTHQKEAYQPSSFLEYSVSPNVMLASYILKEQLDKVGLYSLVEEQSVQDEVNRLGKKYYYSYTVSRSFMEDAKKKNPTLEYFIDLHRDSVSKNLSYLEKEGKGYAKILFIIGLENENYQENYNFTKQIFDKMEEKVPGITRSILQKQGEGVDGVYNQDFSNHTILAEIGGEENTVDEVYNTMLVFAEALKEVILN